MSTQKPSFDDCGLFRAFHVPASQAGAVRLISVAAHCIASASARWPRAPFTLWEEVALGTLQQIDAASVHNPDLATCWHQPPTADNKIGRRVAEWPCSGQPTDVERRLSSLLGLAGVVTTVNEGALTQTFVEGIHTLRLTALARGKRSAHWSELLHLDFLNAQELSDFLRRHGPDAPCYRFASEAVTILNAHVPTPHSKAQEKFVATKKGTPARLTTNNDRHAAQEESESSDSGDEAPVSALASANVGSRIAAADYTSVAAKLGIADWDYMLPEDVATVTRKLVDYLNGTDQENSTYALLGIITLLTGCVDSHAWQLGFSPASIWLDISQGSWCWDFSAYRHSHQEAPVSGAVIEPVSIPLPASVAARLTSLWSAFPTATSLGQLLNASLGQEVCLDSFRSFLRSCGESQHPVYRGRFARSLPLVYLHVTSSDMTTALMTAQFATVAPAALYYFGPTADLIHRRAREVYQFLGLDDPKPADNPAMRVVCNHVLDRTALQHGWGRLSKDISALRRQVLSAKDPSNQLELVNKLTPLLCSAFVIQTAHRASRLECLTYGRLTQSDDAMVILDKNVDARGEPRLIGKTNVVRSIVNIAVECNGLIRGRPHEKIAAEDPLFVVRERVNGRSSLRPLQTSDIAGIISTYFPGAAPNFARSVWVTYLDETGCDRWLVRGLTGHTRDVTRITGPYFDVPPIQVARQLRDTMNLLAPRIFGRTTITSNDVRPILKCKANMRPIEIALPGKKIPDPRTLLAPIDANTLAGQQAVMGVRAALASGSVDVAPSVLALLHLIFIDLVPDSRTCLGAIRDPGEFLRAHGKTYGVLWMRPHFVHRTWIPIEWTTTRLLLIAQSERLPGRSLIRQTASALRSVDPFFWPASDHECLNAAQRAIAAFKRLELPPSLAAATAPEVPAPTLSELSLIRLSCPDGIVTRAEQAVPSGTSLRLTPHRLGELVTLKRIVSKHTATTELLGEKRKRAMDCLAELREEFCAISFLGAWLLDWLIDELALSINDDHDCLALSSIDTYLGVLIAGNFIATLGVDTDPYDWSTVEWEKWIETLIHALGLHISPANPNDAPSLVSEPLPDRVRHPLLRLVDSLWRRGHHIPSGIMVRISLRREPPPLGSSSSVLIFGSELDQAIAIGETWLRERPLDALLFEAMARIHAEVPARAADVSNLRIQPLTNSNRLVMERIGAANVKTDTSVRAPKVSPKLATIIRAATQSVLTYVPDAKYLMRLDGTARAGMRDQNRQELLSAALKLATNDKMARVRSLRATALQELAWPGWMTLARRMLRSEATVADCAAWARAQLIHWHGLVRGCIQAGHADLRAALGHYLSGAMIISSIHTHGMLRNLEMSPAFLRQLGIDPAALRKARQRADAIFDPWEWVSRHLRVLVGDSVAESKADATSSTQFTLFPAANTVRKTPVAISRQKVGEGTREQAAQVRDRGDGNAAPSTQNSLTHVHYLASRILGLSVPRALELTGIAFSTATELDRLELPSDLVALASRRARSTPGTRGSQGNVELLNSDDGDHLLRWLLAQSDRDLLILYHIVFKVGYPSPTPDDYVALWIRLSDSIPKSLTLCVRRGANYPAGSEAAAVQSLRRKLILKVDSDLGARPAVFICPRDTENRVRSSRLSSVFRAGILALHVLAASRRQDD